MRVVGLSCLECVGGFIGLRVEAIGFVGFRGSETLSLRC